MPSPNGTTASLLTTLLTTKSLDKHHSNSARHLIKQTGETGIIPHKAVPISATNLVLTVPFVVNSRAQESLPTRKTRTIDLSIRIILSLDFQVISGLFREKLIALCIR